jgi:hypothetical protein
MSLKEIEAEAEVEGRKAADAADQRNQEIRAAAGRARSPQTDLEKKTQADGLWTDPRTGLIWAATSWAGSAREVCKDVKGGPGWRIADLPELTAIFDPTNSHEYFPGRLPTREYHIAGGIMLREPVVWTSFVGAPATESSGKRIDLPNPPIAGYQSQFWTFDFESGQPVRQPGTFAVGKQVLCVRDTTATR